MKLPNRVWGFLHFLTFVFVGAFIGGFGRSMYGMYKLQEADQSIENVPIDVLLIDVFDAHHFAAYGAIIVFVWWIGERAVWAGYRGMKNFGTTFFSSRRELEKVPDADMKLKMMRSAKADAYLESTAQMREGGAQPTSGAEPIFDNRITAKNGTLTYVVTASRYLTDEEIQTVVWNALQDGLITEPAPGGIAQLTLTEEMENKYLG